MNRYSLREIFELKNVQSCRPRTALGRYFMHQGLPGFSDGSGAIWPVSVAPDNTTLKLQEGCIYRLQLSALQRVPVSVGSLDAERDLIVVRSLVREAGEGPLQWTLSFIPDPGHFAPALDTSDKPLVTRYFKTPTSSRLARLRTRAAAIERTRSLFLSNAYLELDPPTLVPSGGLERYLNSFVTQYTDHRGKQWALQLPTSPELALKKIMCEGSERIFSLDHAYRNNGELSMHHDPEFLMLEWYRQDDDFDGLMTETQKVVETVARAVASVHPLPEEPWPRYRVDDLFRDLMQLNLKALADTGEFRKKAASMCASIVETDTWDDVFCKLFMEFVEPFLKKEKACFVTNYPKRMGALAATSESDSFYVDRFELYIFGAEICNGYRELVDTKDYHDRLQELTAERPEIFLDPQFDTCLTRGIYPCVGNALGLDRLIAILMGAKNIQEILPWPFASRFLPRTVALE